MLSSKQKRPVESSAGTSNPKSPETFSVFTDGSCGEPLEPQHLTIDFTPNEEMDTEFVQKKVCSFWQFIENSPEIHNLRVNAIVAQAVISRDQKWTTPLIS
ncbi:hypothetical protein HW555_014404 [Spodoptera exigua]|uniref:Uncharacterized protein n=1 Tax=Spodoptera exigua TaxID=7107 RepID=A0A835KYW8_SPOEX|nr:hypothetical protein HW555_014404 [Spodoptera exigua]